MTPDPNATRNLAIVIVAGISIGIAVMLLLIANADTLRSLAR